jgi:hypothetical protein
MPVSPSIVHTGEIRKIPVLNGVKNQAIRNDGLKWKKNVLFISSQRRAGMRRVLGNSKRIW